MGKLLLSRVQMKRVRCRHVSHRKHCGGVLVIQEGELGSSAVRVSAVCIIILRRRMAVNGQAMNLSKDFTGWCRSREVAKLSGSTEINTV